MKQVCALVPAYNESTRITSTIEALRSRSAINFVVVIDDGSTDGTAEIARTAGADDVVCLKKNCGKGAALRAGYRAAAERADVFLLLDADLGRTATEADKLLEALERDGADMAIGLLPPDKSLDATGSGGGGMGLVVRLARWGLQRSSGNSWRQPLSGQRAVKKAVLDSFSGRFADGFGVEVALTMAAEAGGFKVVEVETAFRHRVTENGWMDLTHRLRQLFDVFRVISVGRRTR